MANPNPFDVTTMYNLIKQDKERKAMMHLSEIKNQQDVIDKVSDTYHAVLSEAIKKDIIEQEYTLFIFDTNKQIEQIAGINILPAGGNLESNARYLTKLIMDGKRINTNTYVMDILYKTISRIDQELRTAGYHYRRHILPEMYIDRYELPFET